MPGMLLGGARTGYQQLVGMKEAAGLGNNLIRVGSQQGIWDGEQ